MNPKGLFFSPLRGEKWNLQSQVSTSEKSIYLADYGEKKESSFSAVFLTVFG